MDEYHPSDEELAAALREANRIIRDAPTPEQRERIKARVMARVRKDKMTHETWKQIRRTALLGWGLGITTYLVVVSGATADVAVGLVTAAIAGFGAKFVE